MATVPRPNIKIYILCHTEERYEKALTIYNDYYWACPILMKYQDVTFENAFWKQLLEMKDDWISCDMVGTFSCTSYTKLRLPAINRIIINKKYGQTGYYHFLDSGKSISISYRHHPFLKHICNDISRDLNVPMPTDNYCNYWMCTPSLMFGFIEWFETRLKPYILEHPLAMTDSTYKGRLSPTECLEKFGVPYYPHVPFVLERMNKAYFDLVIGTQ
jgi:hypothetical protein